MNFSVYLSIYCVGLYTDTMKYLEWILQFLQKCAICRKGKKSMNGATAGCAVDTCRKTFHFYCARTTQTTVARKMVETMNDGKEEIDRYL